MKSKNLMSIFILSLFLGLLFMPMGEAARAYPSTPEATGWESISPAFWSAVGWIFGYQTSPSWIMIYLLLFVMISFAFKDMIQLFSMFSDITSLVLGIVLGGIT